MSYIRKRSEELTGYQENAAWQPNIDLQCDFVMVYGIDETMPERVKLFKEKGYVVHLMTGISWGRYQDYLNGEFDGRDHWDESQMDRNGRYILHGKDTPYMVPTVSFAGYLSEKLKVAVDSGVEAIHMEEPEFWDHGGYSKAFQREYQLYYKEPWQAPHSSLDCRYKTAKLKAYLYARAIGQIANALKEYAITNYGRILKFYVPTHSLVNYTQWKIMSPEGTLISMPAVDGYIAQVWTGTSRSSNPYAGVIKERTFETAFLEYGVMQELVSRTGRQMWFLHDPIEDNPEYTWEDYRANYLKTLVASLLHPAVHRYEVCPWPRRVFDGVFPRKAGLAGGVIPTENMPGARPIPPRYASLLNSVTQMLGDMEQSEYKFDHMSSGAGVLISDSAMYQRSYPDVVVPRTIISNFDDKIQEFTRRSHGGEDCSAESRAFLKKTDDADSYLAFVQSGAFPDFYGMSLPLVKHGLPLRPVLLENIGRFPSYLNHYQTLILSYEYIKPESPHINYALAIWVQNGGNLLYLGDGSDPYHAIDSWWTRAGYENPAEHLFELLGLARQPKDKLYAISKGHIGSWRIAPAKISTGREIAQTYRDKVREIVDAGQGLWEATNVLTLRRGPYVITAAMDEADEVAESGGYELRGLYADMTEPDYPILTEKVTRAGESAILFDFAKIKSETYRIIGSSARIESLEPRAMSKDDPTPTGFQLKLKAADAITAYMRIRLPKPVSMLEAKDHDGRPVPLQHEWDDISRTILISYESKNQPLEVNGYY